MVRKILDVRIRTIDEKNHVRNWTANDIDLDSLKFKVDCIEKKKPETKKEDPKKETKKATKTKNKK